MSKFDFEKVCNHFVVSGYYYQGSEIYGGLSNTWDYGPLGSEIKMNIRKMWWKKFVQECPMNVGIDAAIMMNPKVWEATGHVSTFNDPLIDCKHCKQRFRADQLIENQFPDVDVNGMNNDQIQVCLEKLKAEKVMTIVSFLGKFKPKYQNFNSEFCSFVRRHHLDSNGDDSFYTFTIEDLKESWEEFYTGGDSWADRLCLFYPAQYLYKMDKNDVVDHEKWEDFMSHSSEGHRLEDGYYYTLQTLDEAFEKFEEDKINMNKNLELILAESFEKTIKSLQKEDLFENVKSFDLNFTGKGINIKLNENRPGNRNAAHRYESFKKNFQFKRK